MPESSMEYRVDYPELKARIIAVKSGWLSVRLKDGSKGIIPRREWSWDRSVRPSVLPFKEGTNIDVVYIPDKVKPGHKVLSIRGLYDPWKGAEEKYHVGQVVKGEVVNLRSIAVFAQIAPGVEAVIWAKDLPLLPNQVPADILTLGDEFFGIITDINFEKRQMAVSINAWLQNRQVDNHFIVEEMKSIFLKDMPAIIKAGTQPATANEIGTTREYRVSPLGVLQKILVVDDSREEMERIINVLNKRFEAPVVTAHSGSESLLQLEKNSDINLIILDISLGEKEYGPDVAREILARQPDLHIIFVSRDPFKSSEISRLEEKVKRVFAFVQKHTLHTEEDAGAALPETILLLQQGLIYRVHGMVARNQGAFTDQLGMQVFLKKPIEDSLNDLLKNYAKSELPDGIVVLEMNENRKEFGVLAAWPEDRRLLFERSLEGLYYSQAREVIEDGEVVYSSKISEEDKRNRFKNFFPLFRYRCCYGVPVRLQGLPVRHGLFVLNTTPDFPWETIQHIRSTANDAAVLLERDMMLKLMHLYEDRYFKGQLFGTFIHELHNHMEMILGDLDMSKIHLSKGDYSQLTKKITGFEQSVRDLTNLTASYSRLINDHTDTLDINEVIQKVIRQLAGKAKEEGNISIHTDLELQIPPVKGNGLRMEQILSNVVLNAIQHIALQADHFKEMNRTRPTDTSVVSPLSILIQSCFCNEGQVCCVSVVDSGPGVAYDLQEQIFHAGISKRQEGQGLGLFISRNLAEAMEGRLFLPKSIRFAGSAFIVAFPVISPINQ